MPPVRGICSFAAVLPPGWREAIRVGSNATTLRLDHRLNERSHLPLGEPAARARKLLRVMADAALMPQNWLGGEG